MIKSQIKYWFSQAYSNLLCAAPHISPHRQHTLLLFILNCSLLFLWVIFWWQYVFFFFLECSVMSLSNMPCNSGSLIFISLANLATSRYHPSLLFFLSLIIVCMPLSSRRKNERRNCFCLNAGSVTWCPEKSESQGTWVIASVLPLAAHDATTGLRILSNKNCIAFSDLLRRLKLTTKMRRSWK